MSTAELSAASKLGCPAVVSATYGPRS